MTYPTIIIISGEGETGNIEAYHGTDSPRAIKMRLAKERCNGDRWARAYRLAQVGDAMSDDIGVYSEIDGDDMRSINLDDILDDTVLNTSHPPKAKIIRIRNIPADVHTALKKRAIDEGISMEALVLRWIEKELKND